MTTLSKQLDEAYLWCVKTNRNEAAEFLKGFLIKYDVIKLNKKVKRGNTISGRNKNKVVQQS